MCPGMRMKIYVPNFEGASPVKFYNRKTCILLHRFLEFNNRAPNDNAKLKMLKMVVCCTVSCSHAARLQHTTIFNILNLGLSLFTLRPPSRRHKPA